MQILKKKLKKSLPKDWATRVYNKFDGKYTRAYIRMILTGERDNAEIREKIIEVSKEHVLKELDKMKKEREQIKQIKSLTNKKRK